MQCICKVDLEPLHVLPAGPLPKVSIVLYGVIVVLTIVCLSTNGWLYGSYVSPDRGEVDFHAGIFRICADIAGKVGEPIAVQCCGCFFRSFLFVCLSFLHFFSFFFPFVPILCLIVLFSLVPLSFVSLLSLTLCGHSNTARTCATMVTQRVSLRWKGFSGGSPC